MGNLGNTISRYKDSLEIPHKLQKLGNTYIHLKLNLNEVLQISATSYPRNSLEIHKGGEDAIIIGELGKSQENSGYSVKQLLKRLYLGTWACSNSMPPKKFH